MLSRPAASTTLCNLLVAPNPILGSSMPQLEIFPALLPERFYQRNLFTISKAKAAQFRDPEQLARNKL